MIDKKILQEFKETLEKEKEALEKELSSFAKKDPEGTDDWNTKYPYFNGGAGSQKLEEAADEIEEYMNLLPIEANFEAKIQAINLALEKMEKGTYGICEKCKKDIPLERINAYPAAKNCLECK